MTSKKTKVKVTKKAEASPNEVTETVAPTKNEVTETVAPTKNEVTETIAPTKNEVTETIAAPKEVTDTTKAFCPKCGKAIVSDMVFCPFCGFSLRSPPTQVAPAIAVPTPTPSAPKQESNLGRGIGIAVAVVIVAIIVFAALAMSGGGGILPSQHTVNIANSTISVGALAYNDYQFGVPSGAYGVSLQGSFTAFGGTNNEIMVIVMNSGNFTIWSSGHSGYQFYYESGRQTIGTFNVSLPAGGTYYLVYNNEFSVLASKSVQTTVELVYTK